MPRTVSPTQLALIGALAALGGVAYWQTRDEARKPRLVEEIRPKRVMGTSCRLLAVDEISADPQARRKALQAAEATLRRLPGAPLTLDCAVPFRGLWDPTLNGHVRLGLDAVSAASAVNSVRWIVAAAVSAFLVLVWGGALAFHLATDTGAAYDPCCDTWTSLSTDGAPSARHSATAIWTGNRMIVWGGSVPGVGFAGDGGIYDPDTDTWSPMSPLNAPSPRAYPR